MTFPKRLPKQKMGVRQERKLYWPRHRKFVRSHCCSVPGCQNRDIEAAHFDGPIPYEDRGGTGRSDHDKWCWPCCHWHHQGHDNPRSYHTIGWAAFDRENGISTEKIALRMQATSPCRLEWREAA